MAICVECKYRAFHFKEDADFADKSLRCTNPDLPMTDYVYGIRLCEVLNSKGDCKGFKAQPQNESIYESKEDEELAKTE